ncbi:MAG: hypothetical protein M3O36_14715 [Myxococcota bacterium]|nr:hypothetical protein [Myxococcota bacterium]
MRAPRWLPALVAAAAGVVVYFVATRDAFAIPSFARKYQTSCLTCHTVFPVLNPFGEAFRRNGYRFPNQHGSVDSDSIKAPAIAMGQEEYTKTFPNSVWPDKITEAVPLSVMFNGSIPVNIPNSDAKAAAGNTFTWRGIEAELHLFGAGAFNDSLTYFTQLTFADSGSFDIETGYLLWNDVIGPPHLVNLWVGRLFAPQLTSFALHSAYLTDTIQPAVSVAGLYNPSASFTLGQGHTDGVELNGIAAHRFGYALGWVASSAASGLATPNAEEVYAHVGVKSGGVALDGEGKYGPNVPDPRKPWAEKSITVDAFAYHGLGRLDNGTGTVAGVTPATPALQNDRFNAIGGVVHGQYDSLLVTAGVQLERHDAPYQGTPATANPTGSPFPGVPSFASATSIVQYDEIDYVLWPWFVPGVRLEYTRLSLDSSAPSIDPRNGNYASLTRVIPGIAVLVRPNIRVALTGDFESAYGLPPAGAWGAARGQLIPNRLDSTSTKFAPNAFEAEQINATFNVAY